jgi:branched-chain amino acid transport system permease protein
MSAPVKAPPARKPRQLGGRPKLYTSYSQQLRMLNTRPKMLAVGGIVVVALLLPGIMPDRTLDLLGIGFAAAIGAIGLNIVSGYAGQVSLGHAFFLGVGAYTAAAVGGDPDGDSIGLGVSNVLVWLPAAGLVAGLLGAIIAPIATRLRGLYLAIVTLGLVFLGQHIFFEWRELTGGKDIGRDAAPPTLFGDPLNADDDMFSGPQKMYVLGLVLLIVFAVLARNLARSKVGRAFAAVRDRDIAASAIGVDLTRYKVLAFGISSAYAGCAGALLYSMIETIDPSSFNLLLSVQYIAMVLIGGIATISGSIMGALFITLLGPVTEELTDVLPFLSEDVIGLSPAQLQGVLYGLLIIGFLIFEPRGLYGIWLRIRNYFKAWPFSY